MMNYDESSKDISYMWKKKKKKSRKVISFSTHIMDKFSLQEANWLQGEQVVKEKSVWVFKSTNDTSKKE